LGTITVLGLGSGSMNELPLGIYRKLIEEKDVIYTRTLKHPTVTELEKEGIAFHSFDDLYEQNESFQHVYEDICETLLMKADERDLIYTVPGHPLVAEQTVQLLLKNERHDVRIAGGQSFLDPLFARLKIDPIDGFQLLDGSALNRNVISYKQHIIIAQVYDQSIASNVKLTLLEDLPYDYPIKMCEAVGTEEESIKTVPLFELDHQFPTSNLMTLYVEPASEELLHHQFNVLRKVVKTLRGPNGCPWDKKQTNESLRPYLIEEAYEVIDAIHEADDDHLAEELGDVLLQVMLHSQIAEDDGFFTVDDVIKSITNKMIERHPHVFGDVHVQNVEDVKDNWEKIKQQSKPKQVSFFDDLNESLPRLLYAYDIQKKVAKIGFDWDRKEEVFKKVTEEMSEFERALRHESTDEAELEFGDILFSLVNLARHYGIDPEIALHRTSQKFISRFQTLEQLMKEDGVSIEEAPLEVMDTYWEKAKKL